MAVYKMVLSTTENNNVGSIKMNQDDKESQIFKVNFVENNEPKNFDGLNVVMKSAMPSGYIVEQKVTDVDYGNSSVTCTLNNSFLQDLGRISAWFSFERPDRKVIDSTKSFNFLVVPGTQDKVPQGNYIQSLSDIQREIEEIIGNKDFTSFLLKTEELQLDKADRIQTELTFKIMDSKKADKQHVQDQFEKLGTGWPIDTLNNVSELKIKYPNGADGPVIVLESDGITGYTYLWDVAAKNWKKGVLYQAQGIAKESIKSLNLKAEVSEGIFFCFGSPPDFDVKTRNLVFTSDFNVIYNGRRLIVCKAQQINLQGNGFIVVNAIDKILYQKELKDMDEYDVVIGGLLSASELAMNGKMTTNGFSSTITGEAHSFFYTIFLSNPDSLFFSWDIEKNTLTIPAKVNVNIGNKSLSSPDPERLPQVLAYTGKIQFISYNLVTNDFILRPSAVKERDEITLGYLNANTQVYYLNMPDSYMQIIGIADKKIKQLSILGDSISTYKDYIPAGNATFYPKEFLGNVNLTWWHKLITNKSNKLNLCVNNSWSGSRVTSTSNSTSAGVARADKLHTEKKYPDLIVFYIGINDYNNGVDLGVFDGSQDFPTGSLLFRDAYAIMIKKAQESYPKAKIYCCTLPYSLGDGSWPRLNSKGVSLSDYNEAIRDIAKLFNIKVIDLESNGSSYYNHQSFLGDGLHPNEFGMNLISEEIRKAVV